MCYRLSLECAYTRARANFFPLLAVFSRNFFFFFFFRSSIEKFQLGIITTNSIFLETKSSIRQLPRVWHLEARKFLSKNFLRPFPDRFAFQSKRKVRFRESDKKISTTLDAFVIHTISSSFLRRRLNKSLGKELGNLNISTCTLSHLFFRWKYTIFFKRCDTIAQRSRDFFLLAYFTACVSGFIYNIISAAGKQVAIKRTARESRVEAWKSRLLNETPYRRITTAPCALYPSCSANLTRLEIFNQLESSCCDVWRNLYFVSTLFCHIRKRQIYPPCVQLVSLLAREIRTRDANVISLFLGFVLLLTERGGSVERRERSRGENENYRKVTAYAICHLLEKHSLYAHTDLSGARENNGVDGWSTQFQIHGC